MSVVEKQLKMLKNRHIKKGFSVAGCLHAKMFKLFYKYIVLSIAKDMATDQFWLKNYDSFRVL